MLESREVWLGGWSECMWCLLTARRRSFLVAPRVIHCRRLAYDRLQVNSMVFSHCKGKPSSKIRS